MRILTVMFLISLWTWLRVVAAAAGPDSPETNEADHSHSAGGCDCMEYWTCVMRYGAPDTCIWFNLSFEDISQKLLFISVFYCMYLLIAQNL